MAHILSGMAARSGDVLPRIGSGCAIGCTASCEEVEALQAIEHELLDGRKLSSKRGKARNRHEKRWQRGTKGDYRSARRSTNAKLTMHVSFELWTRSSQEHASPASNRLCHAVQLKHRPPYLQCACRRLSLPWLAQAFCRLLPFAVDRDST